MLKYPLNFDAIQYNYLSMIKQNYYNTHMIRQFLE